MTARELVSPAAATHEWSERVLLAALAAVTLAAAAGYATFALHPERLATVPQAAVAYGLALRVFPPAHIIIGVSVLAAILTRRAGAAWIPAAVVLYVLSLSSELLGTTVGLPFGPYRYTDGLGVKWFAHVPVLIPASWFMMALPSFALVTRLVTARTVPRVVLAALLLVSWDLALDPAMSRLMPYWVWGRSGPYYGMPVLNLAGWYFTGLVLMLALASLRVDRWAVRVPTRAFAAVYLANLALPALMALAAGIWPAAVLATLPVLLVGVAGMRRMATP